MRKTAVFCSVLLFVSMMMTGCKKVDPTAPVINNDTANINDWINKNKPAIVKAVNTVADIGTNKGLQQWAKKDPAAAKECAQALSKNIDENLLPYFKDGAPLLTSAEVQELLDSSLCGKLPDVVKEAIVAASAVLDFYIPIPDAGTYLTQDQMEIIGKGFLAGVKSGCDKFLSKELSGNRWIVTKMPITPKNAEVVPLPNKK